MPKKSDPTTEVARRADARRNIERILDAAERCLAADPDATMGDIAAAAGLGRVTVYGHFSGRPELIEAVARRVLDRANETLRATDLSGEAPDALARLVEASWEVTVRSGSLLVAAEKALPAGVVRELHTGELEARVRALMTAAQRSKAFRTDLSTDWLVAIFHATLHAAATEIAAGRLAAQDAASVISTTLVAAFQPQPGAGRARRATRG